MTSAREVLFENPAALQEARETCTCFQSVYVTRHRVTGEVGVSTAVMICADEHAFDYIGKVDASEIFEDVDDWKREFIATNGELFNMMSYKPSGLKQNTTK